MVDFWRRWMPIISFDALKAAVRVPIHLHPLPRHGHRDGSVMAAADLAGQCRNRRLAGPSQPTESMVAALRGTPYDQLDLGPSISITNISGQLRRKYRNLKRLHRCRRRNSPQIPGMLSEPRCPTGRNKTALDRMKRRTKSRVRKTWAFPTHHATMGSSARNKPTY